MGTAASVSEAPLPWAREQLLPSVQAAEVQASRLVSAESVRWLRGPRLMSLMARRPAPSEQTSTTQGGASLRSGCSQALPPSDQELLSAPGPG